MKTLPRTQPCLWFDHQAEEAARFYVSVFPNSRIGAITHYGPRASLPEGTVLTIDFELDGQHHTALNGGPHFQFSPAISFVVRCTTQQEVDHYWTQLSAVPEQERCGWLQDRYGVSWQIVPEQLMQMLQHPDAERRQSVTVALLGMGQDQVTQVIAANHALGDLLDISGTPTFVIDRTLVRGYLPLDGMRQIVVDERG